MKKSLFTAAAVFVACAPISLAHAGEFDPHFNGIVSFEVQNDWTYDSDDEDLEVDSLYTTIEPYLILSFDDNFAIEASLVFEPVQDPDPGDDSAFDNEGLYAEELKFTYTGDHVALFAGKFNPSFGSAWDLAPGIYGSDFAEDYEITERIGFGGSYKFDQNETSSHTITANTFFLDTSALSESTITRRGRTDKDDGGHSNTEDLSSFSATLDSENLAGLEGLNTHLGYIHQAEGDADDDADAQNGYAIGVDYMFALSDDFEIMTLAEWASIDNFDGTDDTDYITTSVVLNFYQNWNTAISYTNRNTDVDGGDDADDDLFQLSAGYAFDNGFTIDAGYRWAEEGDVKTEGLGALLAYSYEF